MARDTMSPPTFAVRQAGAADIPVLAQHRAAMFRDMGKLPSYLEKPLEQATASFLREAMPRGEYLAWVAEEHGTPPSTIGGAGVQIRRILHHTRDGADGLELGADDSCL